MKFIVVYESLWGNTAAVARAIAEGLGPDARVLSTAEAIGEALANADLVVAGAPVLTFGLPSEKTRASIAADPAGAPAPPDLSHPAMRTWLDALAPTSGSAAAFDTQVRGPFGKAAPTILKGLERAGYRPITKPAGFIVAGKFGPLRKGELDRAKKWGAELAELAAGSA